MKKYFLKQLEKSKPITKERLSQLKGKTIYGDYKIGDKILFFLNQEIIGVNKIKLELETFTEKELDLLKEDFKLIEVRNDIPILERRSKNDSNNTN